MKNPIIEDFDVNAKSRQLGSPLDGMPQIEKPRAQAAHTAPPLISPTPEIPAAQPKPAIKKAPTNPVPSAPAKPTRQYVRRTFDFFEDQIAYLTRASLEDRLAGGEGSMNSMVREALDAFIEKRRKK
jgi:hypothetical protein